MLFFITTLYEMNGDIKKNIIKGSFWTVFGQFINLFITLFANIWLARVLSSHEFGQLGIILFFITVFNVITEGGLSGALIRKPQASEEDYSTIFIFNLLISVFCFMIILLLSKNIALYYNDLKIQLPLVVSGLTLIINALQMVQDTKLIVDMEYKKKSIYDFVSIILSSAIGVFCAYKSLGLWSLVIMLLMRSFIKTLALWIFEGFFFKLIFSKNSFLNLYGFGVNTTFSSIINMIFDNIYQLILGKMFSIRQVGYYYQAKRLNDVIPGLFITVGQGPLFAGTSKLQGDKFIFYETYTKIISPLLSILGLIILLIFFYANDIIILILGNEWYNSILYLRFLSIASFFYVLENLNRVIFKVYNKTSVLLRLELLKKLFHTLSIFIGIYYKSVNVLLIGFIISNVIGYLLNYAYSKKILNLVFYDEIKIIIKIILVSLTVSFLSFTISYLFNIENYFRFFLILFIVPFYFIFLSTFNVFKINIVKQLFITLLKK